MKKVLLFSALVMSLIGSIGYIAYANRPEPPQPPKQHIFTPEELLAEANKLRAEKGVAPLKLDPRLNQSAQWKADDMLASGNFTHINNGYHGAQKVFELAPECKWASENITGTGMAESPMEDWRTSEKHYLAEINADNDLTGFGVVKDSDSTFVYVQHFCDLP